MKHLVAPHLIRFASRPAMRTPLKFSTSQTQLTQATQVMKPAQYCKSISDSIEAMCEPMISSFGALDTLAKKPTAHFPERRASNGAIRPAEPSIPRRTDLAAKSPCDQIVEMARERFAAWEDELDSLGSSPSLQDIERMLNTAPNRAQSLYRYTLSVYHDMLAEAMIAWEDKLDSMGPFPATVDLELHLAQAPIQHNHLVIFAYGVLAQKALHE
jgi:hypothetical protein